MKQRTLVGRVISLVVASLLALLLFTGITMASGDVHEKVSTGTFPMATASVQATATIDVTATTLANKKLAQEVEQLQHQNDRTFWAWLWNNGATAFSSLALIIGGIFAVVRYFSDRKAERDRQMEEQKRWLEDRKADREKRDEEQRRWLRNQEAERVKRAEERFHSVVEGLGSKDIEPKVGAAIVLRTFLRLRPDYEQFYRQTFDLAVAHLRLRKGDPQEKKQEPDGQDSPIPLDSLSQALITVFQESFPLARELLKKQSAQFNPQFLDASGIYLDNAYLVTADLKEGWMPEASLKKANLIRADLEGADLRGAHLREADLEKAHLREAHLEGADLRGADLEGADLQEVDLQEAHPEAAGSLKNTKMTKVTGLTQEQIEACKAKGAIFDDPDQPTAPNIDTTSGNGPKKQ